MDLPVCGDGSGAKRSKLVVKRVVGKQPAQAFRRAVQLRSLELGRKRHPGNSKSTLWRQRTKAQLDCPFAAPPACISAPSPVQNGGSRRSLVWHDGPEGCSVARTLHFLQDREALSAGGNGIIYMVEDLETSERFACKVDIRDHLAELKRELSYAQTCLHPNVAMVYGLAWDSISRKVGLVMELGQRSLMDMLRSGSRPSQQEAAVAAAQITHGLAHVHGRGIVHCDIKPSNILCFGGCENPKWHSTTRWALADFGLACKLNGRAHAAHVCTTPYRPRELLFAKSDWIRVSDKVDVWSLGLTVFHLLPCNVSGGHMLRDCLNRDWSMKDSVGPRDIVRCRDRHLNILSHSSPGLQALLNFVMACTVAEVSRPTVAKALMLLRG